MFGRHPELLARAPGAQPVYLVAFTLFARAQVALAFVVLALALARAGGARWLPALAAVYAASLASELLGTTVGLPFGPYRYTDGLGPKWLGHVPALIPLSWFTMAVPSLVLARTRRPAATVVIGALVLLAWDLALDPAMSRVTTYWRWGREGPYYGMPWSNLVGWFLTGLALMAILARLGAGAWRIDRRWAAAFYAVNLALPLGMDVAAGYWGAVLATVGGLAACAMLRRAAA